MHKFVDLVIRRNIERSPKVTKIPKTIAFTSTSDQTSDQIQNNLSVFKTFFNLAFFKLLHYENSYHERIFLKSSYIHFEIGTKYRQKYNESKYCNKFWNMNKI